MVGFIRTSFARIDSGNGGLKLKVAWGVLSSSTSSAEPHAANSAPKAKKTISSFLIGNSLLFWPDKGYQEACDAWELRKLRPYLIALPATAGGGSQCIVGHSEGLVKDVSNYTSNSQRCQDWCPSQKSCGFYQSKMIGDDGPPPIPANYRPARAPVLNKSLFCISTGNEDSGH
jgi:hypothetical protein